MFVETPGRNLYVGCEEFLIVIGVGNCQQQNDEILTYSSTM